MSIRAHMAECWKKSFTKQKIIQFTSDKEFVSDIPCDSEQQQCLTISPGILEAKLFVEGETNYLI